MAACADEAQGLTALATAGSRARAGRASLRLRNPANAGPDWVQRWLAEQGERPADQATPWTQTLVEGDLIVARTIQPIAVEAPCLSCHGERTTLSEPVLATLSVRYPQDQATGYALGELRGALWAEARLPRGTEPAPAPAHPSVH